MYEEQNKMFLFQTLDAHEPTGELIGYFDETLYNFLTNFNKKGYFKDTAIIIFSDHGQHLNAPLHILNSNDYFIEKTLPLLILLIPNDEKMYKNNMFEKIKSNEQTFITPFDIYNTLINLAFGNNKEQYKKNYISLGGSLLTKLNYKKRFCESFIYKFQIKRCNCRKKLIEIVTKVE